MNRRTKPLTEGGRLRRTPLRRRSAKATEARAVAVPIVDEVYYRDSYQCVLAAHPSHTCQGRLTPHHLKKAGQGGPWAAVNLVTLCVHGNGWVEDEPEIAHTLGLVIRAGETYAQAWARMRTAGLTAGAQHDPISGAVL